jgi:lysine-specific demethylase/histidyl-hydroxylase NO66
VTPVSSPGVGEGSALARCTDDAGDFLDVDWGRRARVCVGSDRTGFDDLLTLDGVDRALTTTALRTPFFRLVRAGERIPPSAYTRSGRAGSQPVEGIVDPVEVTSLFEQGATIVLQAMHRWSEPVARFCRDLEVELGFPCQVNAYVTPAGAQGLDLHHDPHDVFVLQAFGRKRWEVHAAPGEMPRPPLFADVGAGDTIYMPAGTAHAASTQDQVSGHLTVGVHVAPWRDAVTGAWASIIEHEPSLAESLPAGWHRRDPDELAKELGERLHVVADRLLDLDGAGVMQRRADRFLSSRAPLARGTIADRAAPPILDDTSVVVRRPGAICVMRLSEGSLVLLLGDRRLRMPAWLEPAVRRLVDDSPVTVGELAGVLSDPGSRLVLVRRLIAEGLLQVDARRAAAPGDNLRAGSDPVRPTDIGPGDA